MKTILCFLLCLLSFIPLRAQTDSVTAGDTIGLATRWVVLSRERRYSYHWADRLNDQQIARLLRQSPADDARALAQRSLSLRRLSGGMMLAGYASGIGALSSIIRRPALSGTLLLAGFVGFYGSILPSGMANRRVQQARLAHNLYLRSQSGYFHPLFDVSPEASRPSLADTVHIRRSGGFYRFSYRKADVKPAFHLNRLTDRLGDPAVQSGMKYSRTIQGVSSLLTGLGTGFLSAYVLALALRQNFSPASYRINPRVPAIGLAGIGAGILIRFHANQSEARAMQRHNSALKERFKE